MDHVSLYETCKPHQASSYVVDDRSIMFLPCGLISFKSSDVTYRYCERCKRIINKNFLELSPVARLDDGWQEDLRV
jgi:hypothetical protein